MIMNREDFEGLRVCIGIPAFDGMRSLSIKSLFETQQLCYGLGIKVDLAMIEGNSVVHWARDEVIHLCLESESNRFFLIDADMIWRAQDFVKFLYLSKKYDVICAAYRAKKDEPTFYIYYQSDEEVYSNTDGLLPIIGAGLGFTVVNREVIEKLHEQAPKVKDGISGLTIASIFNTTVYKGERRGEDIDFFFKVKEAGYQTYVDPTIVLGHQGSKKYYGKLLDGMPKKKISEVTPFT